jgi:hypothetical protein
MECSTSATATIDGRQSSPLSSKKKPGNPRIHCLCVISLYKDCYNLQLGLAYHNALHRAEDSHTLNKDNYGSRPCRSSLYPIGLEMLQTEYSSLT